MYSNANFPSGFSIKQKPILGFLISLQTTWLALRWVGRANPCSCTWAGLSSCSVPSHSQKSFSGQVLWWVLLLCPGHSATGDTDTVSLSKPSLKHSLIKIIQFPSPWQHFRLSIYSIWKSVARKREEKEELWKEWEIPVWGKEREGCGKKKGETDASRNGKPGWDHKRAGHGHTSPVISLIS